MENKYSFYVNDNYWKKIKITKLEQEIFIFTYDEDNPIKHKFKLMCNDDFHDPGLCYRLYDDNLKISKLGLINKNELKIKKVLINNNKLEIV